MADAQMKTLTRCLNCQGSGDVYYDGGFRTRSCPHCKGTGNITIKRYVVGLAHDGTRMAFVKKNRPEWQAGLLNGIGGKVEENEDYYTAMVREFYEETGTAIPNWRPLVTMTYPGECVIKFYTALVSPATLGGLYTATDEAIEVHSIEYPSLYPHLFIRNLHWIIPLALHEEEYRSVEVIGHVDPAVGDIKLNQGTSR